MVITKQNMCWTFVYIFMVITKQNMCRTRVDLIMVIKKPTTSNNEFLKSIVK